MNTEDIIKALEGKGVVITITPADEIAIDLADGLGANLGEIETIEVPVSIKKEVGFEKKINLIIGAIAQLGVSNKSVKIELIEEDEI